MNENSESIVDSFLNQVNVSPEAISDVKKEHLKDALKDYSKNDIEEFFRLGLRDAIEDIEELVIDLISTTKKVELRRSETQKSRERVKKMEDRTQSIIMKIKKILSKPLDESIKEVMESSISSLMRSYGEVLNVQEESIQELRKKIGLGVGIAGYLITSAGLIATGIIVISPVLLYCGLGLLVLGIGAFVYFSRRKRMNQKEKIQSSDSTFEKSEKI